MEGKTPMEKLQELGLDLPDGLACFLDILNGILFCLTLRPTAGKPRTPDTVPLFRPLQSNSVFHLSFPP